MRMKIKILSCVFAAALFFSACGASLKNTASSGSESVTENVSEGTGGADWETAAPDETESVSPYHKIDAEEAKMMIEDSDVIIVDVRRPEEYEAGHVPGAVNIPNESISDVQPDALPELDTPLIVYCRTGVRSRQASDKLQAIGYTGIYDMGGIVDWPYDTVTGTEPE